MEQTSENLFNQKLENLYVDSVWENYQREFTETTNTDLDGDYEIRESEESNEQLICPSQIIELMEELDKEDKTEKVYVLDSAEKIFQFMCEDVHK